MTIRWTWALLALGAALTGCGDEDPVGIGRELVPGGEVRTFEVVLDAAEFLVSDTALAGFSRPATAGFVKVAEDAGGIVDAHGLYRFGPTPIALVVDVTPDSVAVDSTLTYPSATLVLRVDTTLSEAPGEVQLELLRTTQEWHPASAGWELRVDTAGARLPWAEEGGSGEPVSSGVWSPGVDSITFAVDSQTVALWTDTTSASRGALVRALAAGTDLRITSGALRLDARPSVRPDTLIPVTVATVAATFVYQPTLAPTDDLRVGGIPAWRTFLDVGALLAAVRVPCADPSLDCIVPLADATIGYAAVVLTPTEGAAGFRPEGDLTLEARPVLRGSLPLVRSPLGRVVGRVTVAADSLEAGDAPIEMPITSFVRDLLGTSPDGDDADDDAPPSRLALASLPESATFGLATFSGSGGAAPPRLRLVVTVASPLEIR